MPRIEFFFDYSCPYAYLASVQIEALAARCGAELVWRPFLLGGVAHIEPDAARAPIHRQDARQGRRQSRVARGATVRRFTSRARVPCPVKSNVTSSHEARMM